MDNALTERFRPWAHLTRDGLIRLLDSAARIAPDDAFLAGQLVRFLVDQADYERAAAAAERCTASAWWCGVLRAYVTARAGDLAGADSGYRSAMSTMPGKLRCEWNDVSALLDSASAVQYRGLAGGCGWRDSVADIVWWLADPLLSQPGNERRAEHYVRRTIATLHAALTRDERFDWRDSMGNDARAEMIFRYGWPAYSYWNGPLEDSEHTGYLAQHASHPNEPYTTYEYPFGRLHLVPGAKAIAEPFSAASTDWELASRTKASSPLFGSVDAGWWPREHFAAPMRLVQLPDPQTAFLRREHDVILATALELPPELLQRKPRSSIEGIVLVVSSDPRTVRSVATRPGVTGASVALWGTIPAQPALVAIEFPSLKNASPAGRTRFGVRPPAPLSAMQPGEVAISDPVLIHPSPGAELPTVTESALGLMAGSRRVKSGGSVGIYWETYGITAADTVQFAVWVERHTPQGIIRRFTNSLQLTRDLNTPIVVSWETIGGGERVDTGNGRIPAVGRSLSVDVSKLPTGAYWMEVAAQVRGREAVRGRTEIVVQ